MQERQIDVAELQPKLLAWLAEKMPHARFGRWANRGYGSQVRKGPAGCGLQTRRKAPSLGGIQAQARGICDGPIECNSHMQPARVLTPQTHRVTQRSGTDQGSNDLSQRL